MAIFRGHGNPGTRPCLSGTLARPLWRFISTPQSGRTAISHSNCVSFRGGGRKKAPWCILLWLRQIYPKWKGRWKRLTSSTNLSKRHSAGFPQQHPRGKGGFRMTWGPCLSPTEDSELIKITNCTCHICHLFNLYVMRWNPCRGVKVVSAEGDAAGKRSPQH